MRQHNWRTGRVSNAPASSKAAGLERDGTLAVYMGKGGFERAETNTAFYGRRALFPTRAVIDKHRW